MNKLALALMVLACVLVSTQIGCVKQTRVQSAAEMELEASRLENKALCLRYMDREPMAVAEVMAKRIDCGK